MGKLREYHLYSLGFKSWSYPSTKEIDEKYQTLSAKLPKNTDEPEVKALSRAYEYFKKSPEEQEALEIDFESKLAEQKEKHQAMLQQLKDKYKQIEQLEDSPEYRNLTISKFHEYLNRNFNHLENKYLSDGSEETTLKKKYDDLTKKVKQQREANNDAINKAQAKKKEYETFWSRFNCIPTNYLPIEETILTLEKMRLEHQASVDAMITVLNNAIKDYRDSMASFPIEVKAAEQEYDASKKAREEAKVKAKQAAQEAETFFNKEYDKQKGLQPKSLIYASTDRYQLPPNAVTLMLSGEKNDTPEKEALTQDIQQINTRYQALVEKTKESIKKINDEASTIRDSNNQIWINLQFEPNKDNMQTVRAKFALLEKSRTEFFRMRDVCKNAEKEFQELVTSWQREHQNAAETYLRNKRAKLAAEQEKVNKAAQETDQQLKKAFDEEHQKQEALQNEFQIKMNQGIKDYHEHQVWLAQLEKNHMDQQALQKYSLSTKEDGPQKENLKSDLKQIYNCHQEFLEKNKQAIQNAYDKVSTAQRDNFCAWVIFEPRNYTSEQAVQEVLQELENTRRQSLESLNALQEIIQQVQQAHGEVVLKQKADHQKAWQKYEDAIKHITQVRNLAKMYDDALSKQRLLHNTIHEQIYSKTQAQSSFDNCLTAWETLEDKRLSFAETSSEKDKLTRDLNQIREQDNIFEEKQTQLKEEMQNQLQIKKEAYEVVWSQFKEPKILNNEAELSAQVTALEKARGEYEDCFNTQIITLHSARMAQREKIKTAVDKAWQEYDNVKKSKKEQADNLRVMSEKNRKEIERIAEIDRQQKANDAKIREQQRQAQEKAHERRDKIANFNKRLKNSIPPIAKAIASGLLIGCIAFACAASWLSIVVVALAVGLGVYAVEQRNQKALCDTFEKYADLSEIAKITDKTTIQAMQAGLEADTWQGYVPSFYNLATYQEKRAFDTAKIFKQNNDVESINAIKRLKVSA